MIESADYHQGRRSAEDPNSPLRQFLADYPAETYLTFNYDCLVEQALMRIGRWVPMDGFGVRAEVTTYPSDASRLSELSASSVLHLHGSLYLYPREFDVSPPDSSGTRWLELKPLAEYVFDPDANAAVFMPFARGLQDLRYSRPEERIIAPIPDKAIGLSKAYVQQVYESAVIRLRDVRHLVAIGYRFGPTDHGSFDPLLRAYASTRGAKLSVVAPDADRIVGELASQYALRMHPIGSTFDQWVAGGYPGLHN